MSLNTWENKYRLNYSAHCCCITTHKRRPILAHTQFRTLHTVCVLIRFPFWVKYPPHERRFWEHHKHIKIDIGGWSVHNCDKLKSTVSATQYEHWTSCEISMYICIIFGSSYLISSLCVWLCRIDVNAADILPIVGYGTPLNGNLRISRNPWPIESLSNWSTTEQHTLVHSLCSHSYQFLQTNRRMNKSAPTAMHRVSEWKIYRRFDVVRIYSACLRPTVD